MDNYPGSDVTQIARFIETALTAIRAAHARDGNLLERAYHQLANIVTGWALSIEVETAEAKRKEELQEELFDHLAPEDR